MLTIVGIFITSGIRGLLVKIWTCYTICLRNIYSIHYTWGRIKLENMYLMRKQVPNARGKGEGYKQVPPFPCIGGKRTLTLSSWWKRVPSSPNGETIQSIINKYHHLWIPRQQNHHRPQSAKKMFYRSSSSIWSQYVCVIYMGQFYLNGFFIFNESQNLCHRYDVYMRRYELKTVSVPMPTRSVFRQ